MHKIEQCTKLLKRALYLSLTATRSLSTSQRGFLLRRSCLSNLILQEQRLLDEGHTIDFTKAFDSVNHRLLLAKLKSSGIDAALLNGIKSYMSNRSYPVQIEGVLAEEAPCLSGILQGSVPDPLLFSVLYN